MLINELPTQQGDTYHAPLLAECRDRLNDLIVGQRVRLTHYGSTIDAIEETEYLTIQQPVEYRPDTEQLLLPRTGVCAYLRQIVLPVVTLKPFVLIGHRQIVISSLLRRLDGSVQVEHYVLRPW